MQRIYTFFLLLIFFFSAGSTTVLYSQQFSTAYDTAACGLAYTTSSTLITKRLSKTGLSYIGTGQPSSLTVSNISAGSNILKAFVWWDVAGSVLAQNSITIKDLSDSLHTVQGVLIGGGLNMCQGKGYAFRADVTNAINGNGIYQISGLPEDTTLDFVNKTDANGVTLLIIYTDPYANFVGAIKINDGCAKVMNDTLIETMNNVSILLESDTAFGKAFMIVSDMQGQPGNTLQLNGSAFSSYAQTFWDYEEKATAFLPAIKKSVFGVRSPNDCSHLIMTGVYFKEFINENTPTVYQLNNDTLISSLADGYQWYVNGNSISGQTAQQIVVANSGIYQVENFNEFGCSILSDTITVKTCIDQIKPNIFSNDTNLLQTDSVNYDLQWYFNGALIPDANDVTDTVMATGYYKVRAYDAATGCIAFSDSIYMVYVGIDRIVNNNQWFMVYPNPVDQQKLFIKCKHDRETDFSITITNGLGTEVYRNNIPFTKKGNAVSATVNLPHHIADGLYWLRVYDASFSQIQKIVVVTK